MIKKASIIYKNTAISTWLDYIQLKFGDANYFEINQDKEDCIVVKSKTNNTEIRFYGYNKIDQTILDYQFSNDDCRGWSGKTCDKDNAKYRTLSQVNLNRMDKVLDTPIYKGWYSEDFYLGNKFYKSNSYSNKNKSKLIAKHASEKLGILIPLLFPISKIIKFLAKKGINGKCKKTIIEPIIK